MGSNLAEKVADVNQQEDGWKVIMDGLDKLKAALEGKYCREHNESFSEIFPEQWMCESCLEAALVQDHSEFVGCAEEDKYE